MCFILKSIRFETHEILVLGESWGNDVFEEVGMYRKWLVCKRKQEIGVQELLNSPNICLTTSAWAVLFLPQRRAPKGSLPWLFTRDALEAKESQLRESPAVPTEVPPPSRSGHQQCPLHTSPRLLRVPPAAPAVPYLSNSTTSSSDWPGRRGAPLWLAEVPRGSAVWHPAGWNRLW